MKVHVFINFSIHEIFHSCKIINQFVIKNNVKERYFTTY